jgi:hypothetical protein
MKEPLRLTNLWTSTTCYGDSLTYIHMYIYIHTYSYIWGCKKLYIIFSSSKHLLQSSLQQDSAWLNIPPCRRNRNAYLTCRAFSKQDGAQARRSHSSVFHRLCPASWESIGRAWAAPFAYKLRSPSGHITIMITITILQSCLHAMHIQWNCDFNVSLKGSNV